jgi:dehydrogenase/reductase SDR family member 7B
MSYFSQKRIWLTGASSGIGEALAYAFNQQGARLILSARRMEELERVRAACASPQLVELYPLDLADAPALGEAAREVWQLWEGLDLMVHNAGISQRSLVRDTQLEVDRRIMEVNYFGTVALTKALLPLMLQQGGGHFTIISSLVGKFGTPYRSSYAASKHALHGFFDSLRAEEAKNNIRVSMICPGFIRTQISVNALTGRGEKLNQMDEAQQKGMAPHVFAKEMLAALEQNKAEVYIGGKETAGVYVNRFLPALFRKVISRAKVR